ncbi:DNA (cytosine-5)-methyltransferase, putative [Plasmodium chabaudi adami]|uniref:DNA (Cytosine-5)-methyltransferase, putative n=1 Tax=Plasmodium chabaudi adami TaxID=5826 RepID=A0A1C6X8G5_PLACE|nr:DNA (cytosine-5)-methyltransferase, putative [Plasmodium chabaudi adami]
MENVRALELYSGIGGFHYSVLQTLINYAHSLHVDVKNTNNGITSNDSESTSPEDISKKLKNVVRFISIDLNPIANETYYHNFKENTIYLTNKKDINKFFKNAYNPLNTQTSSNILKSETKKYKEEKHISQNKSTNPSNNYIGNKIKNDDRRYTKFGDSNFMSDLNNKDYILQTDINNLTAEFFDRFKFYILLISNPCQPYTRLNKNFKEVKLTRLYNENNHVNNHVNNYVNKEWQKEKPNDNLNECHYFNNRSGNNHNDNNSHSEGEEIDQTDFLNNLKIDDTINPFDIEKDKRTYSFFHVCNLLKNMNVNSLPKYIFIENVKNFELSFSFIYFINSIKNNYNFQTYLLSPLQFGIPNERLRFYCICKRKNNSDNDNDLESKQNEQNSFLSYTNSLKPRKFLPLKKKNENTSPMFYTPNLATFLDHNKKYFITSPKLNRVNILNEKLQDFEITKNILQKQSAYCFDIIDINKNENICCFEANNYYNEKNNFINNSHNQNNNLKVTNNFKQLHATCFTSNYARFINGSGSILYFNNKDEQNIPTSLQNYYDQLRKNDIPASQNINLAVHNKNNYNIEENEIKKYENHVRYFTPTEICRLMGYKMHTNKLTDFNQIDKNIYGNIYWNIDHINHVCAYTDNTHYCDITGTNTCILNSNNNDVPINNRRDSKQNYIQNNSCLCYEFQFQDLLTNKQKYKLIGNSVNVTVISLIFQTYNVFKDILNI